jgi:hypothetical protein
MEEDFGILISDTNENYRGMINKYQAKVGENIKKETFADMVVTSKIEAVKSLVGELAYSKRENQTILKDLNKVQREIVDKTLLVEELTNAFKNINFNYSQYQYKKIEKQNDDVMLVSLTDLHIGAKVHNAHNVYNFDIAKKRMELFLEKVIVEGKTNGITDIHVVGQGDYIEHVYMRTQQGHEAEFTFVEQIVKACEIIQEFVIKLSKYFNVTFRSISGNHDRISKKEDNVPHDNISHIINHSLKTLITAINSETLSYIEADNTYYTLITVNGKNILYVHGDRDGKADSLKIAKYSQILGIQIHAIVLGHYHHYAVNELGFDGIEIFFGSLKGVDEYAIQIKKLSPASQGIIIVRENGEIEPKKICLQII